MTDAEKPLKPADLSTAEGNECFRQLAPQTHAAIMELAELLGELAALEEIAEKERG